MSTICLLSPAHIWLNPRVRREADALAADGHTVIVGYRADGDTERDDAVLAGRAWQWHRIDVNRGREPTRWLRCRIRQRAAEGMWRAGGRTARIARAAYCAADAPFLRWAIRQPADLYIAHTQPMLAIAAAAAVHRGVHYAFDCEDLLAEEAADGGRARWRRSLIVSLERRYLPGAAYVAATSGPMADHLSSAYGLHDVHVWHNCFPLSERAGVSPPDDRPVSPIVEAAWVSATVGPGRGLEDALAAISRLAPRVILHVYGNVGPTTERWASTYLAPLIERRIAVLHRPVPADRIIATLARHQIGLSLDGDDCLNRSLTVANKFFYSLQAGLACVASATAGHRSVVPVGAPYGVLYPAGDVRALVSALERLLVPGVLAAMQRAAWDAGGRMYVWDRYRTQVLTAMLKAAVAPHLPPSELPMEPLHA